MDPTKNLSGEIVAVNSLSKTQVKGMYDLMNKYYSNVKPDNFQKDLSEKKDAIILRNGTKKIKGFSTLSLLEETIDKEPITVLFSGDTIIDKEYWGGNELPKWWGRYAFSLIDKMPDKQLYWFLMSKGYKTYRFLPVFFNEFYPKQGEDFPEKEKKILDVFASAKFPKNYDSKTGIISFNGEKDCLKEGVADIDESRMQNSNIKYFIEKNPNWKQGDELCCIIKLTKDNFNRMGHRIVGEM